MCQWVGYPDEPEQNTWEPETKVRDIAQTIHDEWLEEMQKMKENKGPTKKGPAKKGVVKKGTAKSKAKNKA